MNKDRVWKIGDEAYVVPSYSMQSLTPSYHLYGSAQVVGAVEDELEDQQEQLVDDEYKPKTISA